MTERFIQYANNKWIPMTLRDDDPAHFGNPRDPYATMKSFLEGVGGTTVDELIDNAVDMFDDMCHEDFVVNDGELTTFYYPDGKETTLEAFLRDVQKDTATGLQFISTLYF